MVTIGAQHAIGLLSRALVGRGDRAAHRVAELPARLRGAARGRRAARPRARSRRTARADERETRLAGSMQAFRHSNPVAAYLMPDFHNPTGRTMSAGARERVLDAAARQGTVVIADETTGELDIDRRGDFPAAGRRRPGRA